MASAGGPAFPGTNGETVNAFTPAAAPTGTPAPDLPSGVAVASNVSQATLTAGSGGGVSVTAATSQAVDPSIATVSAG